MTPPATGDGSNVLVPSQRVKQRIPSVNIRLALFRGVKRRRRAIKVNIRGSFLSIQQEMGLFSRRFLWLVLWGGIFSHFGIFNMGCSHFTSWVLCIAPPRGVQPIFPRLAWLRGLEIGLPT